MTRPWAGEGDRGARQGKVKADPSKRPKQSAPSLLCQLVAQGSPRCLQYSYRNGGLRSPFAPSPTTAPRPAGDAAAPSSCSFLSFLPPFFVSAFFPSLKALHPLRAMRLTHIQLPRELAGTSEVRQGRTPTKREGVTAQTKLHAARQPAPPSH